jgi:hypothetical protein
MSSRLAIYVLGVGDTRARKAFITSPLCSTRIFSACARGISNSCTWGLVRTRDGKWRRVPYYEIDVLALDCGRVFWWSRWVFFEYTAWFEGLLEFSLGVGEPVPELSKWWSVECRAADRQTYVHDDLWLWTTIAWRHWLC